ncbi:MAG TPA: hypothetical protein VKB69_00875 [Micromonosporaceae bacterium]|nr:hypothetical protein [Micromonosporaceae bacterium]
MRGRSIAVMAPLVIALAVGCATTTVPTSDTTPPHMNWVVSTGSVDREIYDTGSVSSAPGDLVEIWLIGHDHEGVKSMTISGVYTVRCQSAADQGRHDRQATYPKVDVSYDGGPGSEAFQGAPVEDEITPATGCDAGLTWLGTTSVMTGVVTNFFGLSTRDTLTVETTPPA